MTPEELLDELRAAGRVDSQGKFTLAGEQALEKLRRFQLKDPSQYLLFALRAAVAAGATALDIDFSPTRIRIGAPDWVPPARDDLLSGLFLSPDEAPAAYYLGVVANIVRVEVDAGGLTIRHRLTPLRLLRALSEWALLLAQRPLVPTRVGQQQLGRAEPASAFHGTRVQLAGEEGIVDLAPLLLGPSRLRIYKHGVAISRPPPVALPRPHVQGYVRADSLRLDLTGESIVDDARWQAVLRDLLRALGLVVERMCSRDVVQTPALRGMLLGALVDRCLWVGTGGRRLKVPRQPVALGMPPPEILRPSTPEMRALVECPIIELSGGHFVTPRVLASKVRRAWGPPPATEYERAATQSTQVLANVSPVRWRHRAGSALFLDSNSVALLEAWPSQPVSL